MAKSLELYSKPILVYTIKQFENYPEIGGIILVILGEWMEHCHRLIDKFSLKKVKAIIPGGQVH